MLSSLSCYLPAGLLMLLLHLPSPQGAKSMEKCSTCRQHLAEVRHYSPGEGAGAEQVIAHPAVNICMDTEDDQALQYKLTDFAVYDKVSDTEQQLVPIFAESLLSRYKKLYLAGKVLRLGSKEGEEGLKVGTVSPCTESSDTATFNIGLLFINKNWTRHPLLRPSCRWLTVETCGNTCEIESAHIFNKK